jgi:hypothetical protein
MLLAPATVAAERQPIVTFSGGMSAIGPLDPPDAIGGPEAIGLQLRGIVSFEEAPLPYKEPKGYVFAGVIVPEIFVGAIITGDEDSGEKLRTEMVGGGVRLEAMFSQRKMGLLQVSARGGFYVAGRGGFFTDPDRTLFLEGAFGEYFLIGDTARIGIELGIMSIRLDGYEDVPQPGVPVDGGLGRVPFENGRGSYLNINAAAYLGFNI